MRGNWGQNSGFERPPTCTYLRTYRLFVRHERDYIRGGWKERERARLSFDTKEKEQLPVQAKPGLIFFIRTLRTKALDAVVLMNERPFKFLPQCLLLPCFLSTLAASSHTSHPLPLCSRRVSPLLSPPLFSQLTTNRWIIDPENRFPRSGQAGVDIHPYFRRIWSNEAFNTFSDAINLPIVTLQCCPKCLK